MALAVVLACSPGVFSGLALSSLLPKKSAAIIVSSKWTIHPIWQCARAKSLFVKRRTNYKVQGLSVYLLFTYTHIHTTLILVILSRFSQLIYQGKNLFPKPRKVLSDPKVVLPSEMRTNYSYYISSEINLRFKSRYPTVQVIRLLCFPRYAHSRWCFLVQETQNGVSCDYKELFCFLRQVIMVPPSSLSEGNTISLLTKTSSMHQSFVSVSSPAIQCRR